jgi:hypothetical protein
VILSNRRVEQLRSATLRSPKGAADAFALSTTRLTVALEQLARPTVCSPAPDMMRTPSYTEGQIWAHIAVQHE